MPLALIHAEIVSPMPAPSGLFCARKQKNSMSHEDTFQQDIAHALAAGEKRMDGITDEVTAVKLEQAEFLKQLQENTAATKRIEANTAEMLEAFESFKGAMRVLEWIGKAAKPIGYIVGLCAAITGFWTALKTGATPK